MKAAKEPEATPELALDIKRDKAPGAFRTISEVSEELDIPAHVLRFWESKFPQLSPMKRGGGRRYYRPADVALLKGIRALLYDEGLTIKGLQKVFRERGPRFVVGVGEGAETVSPLDRLEEDDAPATEAAAPAPTGRLRGVIARLKAARERLAQA